MEDGEKRLRTYMLEIERLREENSALRLSSESFADLAERLNKRLQEQMLSSLPDGGEPTRPTVDI
jgi:hypothetical protein